MEAPGTKNGVIVDAAYWLHVEAERAKLGLCPKCGVPVASRGSPAKCKHSGTPLQQFGRGIGEAGAILFGLRHP